MQVNYLVSFIFAVIVAGTPLLFATLGEIITEKVGNMNLGVEGMMYIGAAASFAAAYYTDSAILFLVAAVVAGILASLIYALLTVTLKANQSVTGLALTIFGTGLANFVGETITTRSPTHTAMLNAAVVDRFNPIHIPGLSDIPIIGKLFFSYNPFVYFVVFCAILAGFFLYRSIRGLNLRAVGENTAAADASGINVTLYKYLGISVGGALSGMGGAYIIMITCGGTWTANCVSGLGWIAVALVIFAGWNPYKAIFGSAIFGALRVLRFYVPKSVINIPNSFYAMLPFVVTALVIIFTSIRNSREIQQPAGCGVNYYREER